MNSKIKDRLWVAVPILLIGAVFLAGILFLVFKEQDTKVASNGSDFALGEKYTDTENYAYKSDKYDLVYKDGYYAKIQDGVVKMLQWTDTVPDWKMSCEEILKKYPEYSRDSATFECYDGDGNVITPDLSQSWENASFSQLYVYWKTKSGGGYTILLSPGYAIAATQYLYYSDLESDLKNSSTDSTNSGGTADTDMTDSEYEEIMKQLQEQGVYDNVDSMADTSTDTTTNTD